MSDDTWTNLPVFYFACKVVDTIDIALFNKAVKHGLILPGTMEERLAEDLIEEEMKELSDSFAEGFTDAERLKEMTDVVWVILSYCIRKGWNFGEAFYRLGQSNLSKLHQNTDGDYWAEYHPSGKVKKSINYKPPYLDDLVFANLLPKKDQPMDMDKYPA